jgi:ABC-type nitrate/sulfonate/bicarbonate transport system substrate-binding protein
MGALPLVAANAAPPAERVVFHAGWFPSAQLAGIYTALDQGFYRDAGLAVEIAPFAFGQDSPAEIDAEPSTCALGTIEGYILLQKRAAGTDLRALAAMLQESPAGYMTLASSGIGRIQDFPGHRIGVHKFAEALFDWFCRRAGVPAASMRVQVVDDDITRLTGGAVDVMQGYATEEFLRVQAATAGAGRFLSFASLGFPSYSEILYTTAAQTGRHEAALRRFLAATRRGWDFALSHPEAAVDAVAARQQSAADRAHLRRALAALEAYVRPGGRAPLAPMDVPKWRALQDAGREIGLVTRIEPEDAFLLNW